MRFDVHKVRTYLVNELEVAPVVRHVTHDGTDIILVELNSGETVIIQLVERLMPVNEIRITLQENTAAGRHTLLILWGDMLLPQEGKLCDPEDWMEALYSLYGDKIYGYDSFGPYASVFPVYFDPQPQSYQRFIRYGDSIRAGRLHCEYVRVESPHVGGFWRVADFEGPPATHTGDQQQQSRAAASPARSPMSAYYAVLELPMDADREAIRTAYRQLARAYHPDLNTAPDSTAKMQQLNEAYRHIMQQFGEE